MTRNLHQLLKQVDSPSYIVDIEAVKKNMKLVDQIREEARCKILLATKAFALPALFPIMKPSLDGTTASGLYEAKLGREEMGKEVHVYAPAYKKSEFNEIIEYADHVYFNNAQQIKLYGSYVRSKNKKIGLRINPGYSNATLGGELYNPCAPCSRFGALPAELPEISWNMIDILHAHVLCESLHEGSVELIRHIAKYFGEYVKQVKAVNFGGGHFLNKPGYNIEKLITAINEFRQQFPGTEIILEPGAGIVVDAGYLVATVLALHQNDKTIAILDTSASCHMPDVLEVPYRPAVVGAGEPEVYPYTYLLTGRTCMTGDVIGEYSFKEPLVEGSRIIFCDMLQYSFVKNNTFNGTPLPNLILLDEQGITRQISNFGYNDFRGRLGYL